MKRCKWHETAVVVALTLMVWASTSAAQGTKPLPAHCVGFLYIESLPAAVEHATMFFGATTPGTNPPPLALQFGMKLKNQSLVGIDQTRPMGVIFLNPKVFARWDVFLATVTDPAQFLAGAAQQAKDTGEVDGIHTLTASEFDYAAYFKAKPEEKQNRQQFMKPTNYYVAFCGATSVEKGPQPAAKTLVFAGDQLACATVRKWVMDGSLDPSKSVSVKGDLVGCINVKSLMDIYGPELDERLAPLMKAVEQGMSLGVDGVRGVRGFTPQSATKILKLEIDAVVAVARQVDTLQFGLDLRPEGVRVRALMVASPDTALTRFIAAQKPAKPDMLRFIPADAAIAGECNFTWTEELKDSYISFVDGILSIGDKPVDPAQKAAALKLVRDLMAIPPANVAHAAFGVLTSGEERGGITFALVDKCTEPAKRKSLATELLRIESEIGIFNATVGENKLTEKAEVFEGVEVTTVESPLNWKANKQATDTFDR
jgi:hypothetical protein